MLHASPASDAPTVGQVLDGRFRLLQVVTEDRAGVVFDALDEHSGEVVRLRGTVGPVDGQRLGILHDGLARPTAVSADGTYVVFADLDDEPLRPPLFPSVDRMAHLAEAVLPTLAVLHEHGVVHGDLLPSSFWLDRHGQVRIVDLGLATQLSRRSGDAAYVAPERAFGRDADDPRIDVYAIAAILFHHATGVEPSAEALQSADLPPAVRQVLALALDPRPVFRPIHAGAFHRALVGALERTTPEPEDVPEEPDGTLDGPESFPEHDTLPPSTRRQLSAPLPPGGGLVERALLPWWTALFLIGGLCMLTAAVLMLVAIALGSATLL